MRNSNKDAKTVAMGFLGTGAEQWLVSIMKMTPLFLK
jgi:hypothetical protein